MQIHQMTIVINQSVAFLRYFLFATRLSSNQRRFLCCFAVKKSSNVKASASLSSAICLSSLSWRDKWRVSWFNDFISRLSSETKPRPKRSPTLSMVWQFQPPKTLFRLRTTRVVATIDIWHLFRLISRIPGLLYSSFSLLQFFLVFSYRYFLPF